MMQLMKIDHCWGNCSPVLCNNQLRRHATPQSRQSILCFMIHCGIFKVRYDKTAGAGNETHHFDAYLLRTRIESAWFCTGSLIASMTLFSSCDLFTSSGLLPNKIIVRTNHGFEQRRKSSDALIRHHMQYAELTG
jgi:hypothetical protein